jgi:membrane-associated protein
MVRKGLLFKIFKITPSMAQILDFFLHLDRHVEQFFLNYQTLSYFIICLILFCETGLVVTPFLPGDSLLFAVGATIAKIGVLQLEIMIPLMIVAVLLGDNVNYFMGKNIGKRLFETKNPILQRILKPEYLERTEAFYEKHGGKTVIMARFVPIVRTFAPFVAGLGAMEYRKYISFCIGGGILWVVSLTLLGYFFGTTEFVKNNFELVILGIIVISVLPAVVQVLIEKFKK